jgi:hypothetical protein
VNIRQKVIRRERQIWAVFMHSEKISESTILARVDLLESLGRSELW